MPTVKDLREFLINLPDDVPVHIEADDAEGSYTDIARRLLFDRDEGIVIISCVPGDE